MELDATIESFSVIRVAVLAVGHMPPVHLRDYVEMVAQYTQVELKNIKPFYTEHQKSPFTQLPWEDGKLKLKFMVGGSVKSPWEDFQAHRKIHGVIGFCHCPFSHDLGSTYEKFTTICNAYSSAQVTRCFAFHPSEDQVRQESTKNFVLFPPADRETLRFHMQNVMQEFAAAMLMEFEEWVLLVDPLASALVTPLDFQGSASSEEASKTKKKRLGRVQKTMGDYCLLAGSHLDAIAHYVTAAELSRLTGDALWHAGAAEGSLSAQMTVRKKDQSVIDEVKARYFEIIQLYKRGTALCFELEASLKLAKLLCRKELAKDVAEILSSCIGNGKHLLDANDRLVLFIEIARVYGALGYDRKAAFYSREVAHLYLQQHNHWAALSALQVLRLVTSTYRLTPSKFDGPLFSDAKTRLRSAYEGQWSGLQIDVLGDMLAAATRGGDALAAWSAASQLLRGHYPLISPSTQISLVTALATAAVKLPSGTRSSSPALPFVRLHSFPQQNLEVEFVERKPGKKDWWLGNSSVGPFIYTPLSGKREKSEKLQLTWIIGEPVHVLVEVANPCAFEVCVESICLSVQEVEFEAFPFSFVLPPNGSELIMLSGKPLTTGSLTVRGCFVKYYGVVTEHSFGLSEAEKGLYLADPFRGSSALKLPPPDIKVISSLPCLIVDITGAEGDVVFYEGEVRNLTVNLCNISSVPVSEANISLIGRRREHIITVADDVLQAALPLSCGGRVSVPVKLQMGRLDSQGEKKILADSFRISDEGTLLHMLIHYTGEAEDGADEISPGRRLTIPLRVRILQGLRLIKARLLAMEIPLQLSRTLPGDDDTSELGADAMVKMDPYRGSWNLRLLELELWNGTEEVFDITVSIRGKEIDDEAVYASTRIDRDRATRVLVPLEKFKLATLDKPFFARALQEAPADEKCAERKAAEKELNSTVAELCSRICVKWSSGKNSTGELQLKDAIREALKESVFNILLPDPLTFGFRLAKGGQNEATVVSAHELVPIEMLVRNNTTEDISVELSVACQDVTGASCLSGQQTVLWSGALDGVDVELSALGEAVHRFELCFLVPGEYTLLGAALISSHNNVHQSICYCGPPFSVQASGFT